MQHQSSEPTVTQQAAETLDGWYTFHDFRRIDWSRLKQVEAAVRTKMVHEFQAFLSELAQVEEQKEGSHALYTIIGQKADLVLMVLRPTMEDIQDVEVKMQKLDLYDYLIPPFVCVCCRTGDIPWFRRRQSV